MDCRETQALLNAFHDGELPAAERARVEGHLRGCPECGALLADLARMDQAAGVPDPGPAYWDRFNARVMDRVGREADGPGVRVLRPKGGWMREQLRYLVPAAAAAALVVVIVHYGGMTPGVSTTARDGLVPGQAEMPRGLSPRPPAAPPAASERAAPDSAGERMAKAEPAPLVAKKPGGAADGMPPEMQAERKGTAGATAMKREQQAAGTAKPASGTRMAKEPSAEAPPAVSLASAAPRSASPCDLARTLAERERIRDAETAQRACLAGDLDAPSREKGLVFLAELLDRQERFSEADAVIAEVEKQYPQSRPLDLYRQQRLTVQKEPKAVPVTR